MEAARKWARKPRPVTVKGDVAYVPLTRGYKAIIDAKDAPLVDGYNWQALVTPHTVYAVRTDNSGPRPRSVRIHRVILGEPDGVLVDHIDGDGLNNCRANLREATPSQNSHNTRIGKNNTSGFKGASWNKRTRKWMSQIAVGGRQRHLGYFFTAEEAHSAYMAASFKLHGEYGRVE